MYSRIVILPGGSKTHYRTTTHIEKRAPTDESVRLLREMEAKAQDQIDKTIRLESNGFTAIAHLMKDMLSWEQVARIHFALNGRKMLVECRQPMDNDMASFGKIIHKAISDRIASEVLNAIADQCSIVRL